MTSQIRSHIEYLIPIDSILVLLLHFNLIKNLALITDFQHDIMIIQKWLTFYWTMLYNNTIHYSGRFGGKGKWVLHNASSFLLNYAYCIKVNMLILIVDKAMRLWQMYHVFFSKSHRDLGLGLSYTERL